MATTDAAKVIAGSLMALFLLCGPVFAQMRQPGLFTVSNVKASAEAANAVDAKKLATQAAIRNAFRQLVSRLGDYKTTRRIPELAPEQVERLVSNMDVRGEGVSNTSYVATFGVTFSERPVVGLLRQYGVTPMVDRAPEILIVPVYVEDGALATSDRNPWRSALADLDIVHAQVPAKLAPARSDLTEGIAKAYYTNPAAGLETLKSQYKTQQVVLAFAEMEGGGDTLNIKLVGTDALGIFTLQRQVKARDGIDEAALQSAARLAFNTLQQRWKLMHGSLQSAEAMAPRGGDAGTGLEPMPLGDLVALRVNAEFSGLREWQAIRQRLQTLPGVQNWELRSVNPRSAEIGLAFPGGAEKLAEIAQARGLSIESGPEGLTVRAR